MEEASDHTNSLTALLVTPEADDWVQLLEQLSDKFSEIQIAKDIENALRVLEAGSGSKISLVLFSAVCSETELFTLLEDGRSSRRGQDSAYVMVLSDEELDQAAGRPVMQSVDGFFFTPSSIASPHEFNELCDAVKQRREEERERPALEFLLEDTLRNIDSLAKAKAEGKQINDRLKYLESLKLAVTESSKDLSGLYYNLAVEVLESKDPKEES